MFLSSADASGPSQILTNLSPESFLTNNVLTNPTAQQKLKLWLSAANSAYVLNFKFARRPKVWLLTGHYVLEGARTVVSRGKSSIISAGVSSAIIGAVSGVPVGGSVSLGVGSTWEMAMQVAEPHVWAAQFRLVDARFIRGKGDGKVPCLGLYRDIMSVNTARGGVGSGVELGLEKGVKVVGGDDDGDEDDDDEDDGEEEEDEREDQDSEEMVEYEKRLEQAIMLFEKAPKHFLQ